MVNTLDISSHIKQRLVELGLGQKDLASAAQVTESYVSQLLAGKKTRQPRRDRYYEKIGEFLRLPSGELAKLAEAQRRLEYRRRPRSHRRLCSENAAA